MHFSRLETKILIFCYSLCYILSGIPERDIKESLKKKEKDIKKKKQYQYNYKLSEFENEWINK